MSEDLVHELAEEVGGTITEMGRLPDGSGFATMSMPLPKNHWSTINPDGFNVPAMPFRTGTSERVVVLVFPASNLDTSNRMTRLSRNEFAEIIREAGRYAYRCSTMNGKETDLDPDALLQNLVVALLGYWTADGLSSDEWANPKAND